MLRECPLSWNNRVCQEPGSDQPGRTLSVQASHIWRGDSAVFDEDNLISHAGLVPLLELAEQTGLSPLLDQHVRFTCERVKSGAPNATPKLTSIIPGMAPGAD